MFVASAVCFVWDTKSDFPSNPIEGIVKKEELVDSKFEKMDDQDDIYTIYEKL